MAETTNTPEETVVKPDVLAGQDIMGKSTGGTPDPETLDALDKLAAEKTKEKEEAAAKVAAQPQPDPDPNPNPPPPDEEAAKAKAEAEAKAKEEAAAKQKAADDLFKDVQLPPGARPKSAEAFAAIKLKAAQEISNLQSKLADAEKAVKERDDKLKNPVPPEMESELKELRSFRAKFDIEADPKWKEYDSKAKATEDFIYAQLKKHPDVITEETLKKIVEYGGPTKVNMDKILDAINDPATARIVQSKLADLAQISYDKESAVESAKKNSEEYIQQRAKEMTEAGSRHTQATAQHVAGLLSKLDWYSEQKPGEKATEDDKKNLAERNKWFKEVDEQVKAALKDDSPEMRAIMVTGMAQLFNLQRDHASTVSELTAAKKQIEELTTKLERFKSASTTRLRENIPPGELPKPKTTDDFNKPTVQALDELAARVMAEREAKGR